MRLTHAEIQREWDAALAGPRMHHGWILAGRQGLGKSEFALDAARQLVARGATAPQPDGEHPDIHLLSRPPKDDKEVRKRAEGKPFERKRNISVDQIRAMQRRLTTRPTLGRNRAIIIDPADDLEKGASNALLKSLEEPPVGTFFILVTHRLARLLPTIRSRCRVLRFNPLPDAQVEKLLKEESPSSDAAVREAAVAAAKGSPGAAIKFIEQDLAPLAAIMRDIVAQGDRAFELRGALSAAIGARPNRERVQATFDLARTILAEQMATVPSAQLMQLADAHADMVALAGQAPTYNFDPGFLAMEIGSLLASAAPHTERANV
ncbi:DNA polymerase III subunit delta' [Erythrobacter litoralis]|uniref:DNA polymerase III delta prime subunit n=1 Tax=Erythrobacter litoralis (strain HTCC2594) TaxID=314225 RepID=Q2NAF5_ERYLH|nr:DNA polymerase III subunit delta' [Erythrobacter litoralis]ABC63336.1 DNA polymerase III delta prime subunit [Erythrobacter litoralis HTCC2594]